MTESNPMQGFAQLNLNLSRLLPFMEACIAHKVKYGLGSKDPTPLNPMPIDYAKIDCSGFFREAIKAMGGPMLPDGSWNEDAWLKSFKDGEGQHLKASEFKNTALHDGRLRACTHIADDRDPVGHIWLVLNGVTYESYGGHGPGMRAWNTPVLERIVTHVYVLKDA